MISQKHRRGGRPFPCEVGPLTFFIMIKFLRALLTPRYRKYYPVVPDDIDLLSRLPRKDLNKLKVLNVGVGDGWSGLARQLPFFDFGRLDHIDIHQPYLDAAKVKVWDAEIVNFINADIRNFGTSIYDLVLMFDVLEHLPKADALAVLDKIKCKQIVFIPLEREYRENTFGVKSQDHLSFWTEREFRKLGYKTEVLHHFHQEGKMVFGALWATKL